MVDDRWRKFPLSSLLGARWHVDDFPKSRDKKTRKARRGGKAQVPQA
jgi:hypothetical protein